MRRQHTPAIAESFEGMRSDYAAAKAGRFRRRRTGVPVGGAGADYHYRSEADYLRVLEYARDFDRNDMIVGQIVDRAVTNTIQDGITPDPDTGDKGVDRDLAARWEEWAGDPEQCDLAGEMTFWDMERLALRHSLVDGDCLGLPNRDTGALELVEGHRLRTPKNTTKNVVNGVLLDPATRKRLEYWLTREDVAPGATLAKVADVKRYAARDEDGFRQVFHVRTSKRISQTRGMSAFAPIFDACGMFEDINFATLVQRQLVACFAIFKERDLGFQLPDAEKPLGEPSRDVGPSGGVRILEGVGPGMMISGQPGEKYRLDSPRVPGAEFFPHMKLVLTLIGINLGLPLVMALMDASETNFSGWRGAVDQARMGFRSNQRGLTHRWHRPVWTWKARQWAEEDEGLRRQEAKLGNHLFRAKWNPPTWPYIEPYQDASADLLRTRNALISQRRRCAERNMDWDDLSQEIVADNAILIERAHQRAEQLNTTYPGIHVTWREVACLPTPDGVNVSLQPGQDRNTDTGSTTPKDTAQGSPRDAA